LKANYQAYIQKLLRENPEAQPQPYELFQWPEDKTDPGVNNQFLVQKIMQTPFEVQLNIIWR
jgi:hypothetical protein